MERMDDGGGCIFFVVEKDIESTMCAGAQNHVLGKIMGVSAS